MSDYMVGDKDNSVAVPFSDDESAAPENDNDEDSPNASPEERITRLKKKEQRTRRMLEEGKQNAERVKNLEGELGSLKEQLATLRGYVSAQPQARAANDDGKDPYEKRLDAVYDRQGEAYNAAQAEIKAGTFTPERQKHYERVAREIESEKTSIHTERTVARQANMLRQEQAQQVWVQKYPEVYNNQRAFDYAKATFARRQALGEVATHSLVDEIMEETKTQFKLGAKPAPSASDRARMSGMPAAGSGGGAAPKSGLSPELRRMAIAAHSDLSEADAIKKWEATTGKRLRARKVI